MIAFNTRGLPDIVDHQQTGYLAKPFDTQDLARGIAWVLSEADIGQKGGPSGGQLGAQARERAVARFDAAVVASAYQRLYTEAMAV